MNNQLKIHLNFFSVFLFVVISQLFFSKSTEALSCADTLSCSGGGCSVSMVGGCNAPLHCDGGTTDCGGTTCPAESCVDPYFDPYTESPTYTNPPPYINPPVYTNPPVYLDTYSNSYSDSYSNSYSDSYSDSYYNPYSNSFSVLVKNPVIGGTVVSNDGKISCGSDCSEVYDNGDSVTLTARPVSSYWKFNGWAGDCSGQGQCILNVNSDKFIIANFVPRIFDYEEF